MGAPNGVACRATRDGAKVDRKTQRGPVHNMVIEALRISDGWIMSGDPFDGYWFPLEIDGVQKFERACRADEPDASEAVIREQGLLDQLYITQEGLLDSTISKEERASLSGAQDEIV